MELLETTEGCALKVPEPQEKELQMRTPNVAYCRGAGGDLQKLVGHFVASLWGDVKNSLTTQKKTRMHFVLVCISSPSLVKFCVDKIEFMGGGGIRKNRLSQLMCDKQLYAALS